MRHTGALEAGHVRQEPVKKEDPDKRRRQRCGRHDVVDRHEDRLREAWLRGPIEEYRSAAAVAHALTRPRRSRDLLRDFPAELL
jgi:hypothetical protein